MLSKKEKQQSWGESMARAAEIFEDMKDWRGAFKCLSAAARFNHNSSQLNLGNLYASGRGARKNLGLAEYWYKRAYKGGNLAAAYNLALDKKRQGDVDAAISWLKKAAARRDGSSYLALAEMYSKKVGGIKKAVDLLQQALEFNSEEIFDDDREKVESLLRKLQRGRKM